MLGISLLPLDLRSGRTMSAEMHLQFIDAQEPERIGVFFALLQDLQNSLSLITGLQRLHPPTNAPGTLWVGSSSVSYLQWRPSSTKVSPATLPDLWHALHLSYNAAANHSVQLSILDDVLCLAPRPWVLFSMLEMSEALKACSNVSCSRSWLYYLVLL